MELPDEVVDDLRKRLRRAGGQVQAVEKMLAEGRECRDIVTQLSAAINALEQTGFRLVAAGPHLLPRAPRRGRGVGLPPRRGAAALHEAGVTSARTDPVRAASAARQVVIPPSRLRAFDAEFVQ